MSKKELGRRAYKIIFDRNGKRSRFEQGRAPWSRFPGNAIGAMLPNMVTLAALCMGLSGLHFAFLQQWQHALISVLVAGVLDGLDGRLAQWLKASSDFGAELDSLVDFINFGVAPSMIVYCYALHHWGRKGWGLCLFFSACMALRLARFNIQRLKKFHSALGSRFSVGVPAPAGALLVLSPLMVEFISGPLFPTWIFGIMVAGVAFLLISRYPTFVLKSWVIAPFWRPWIVSFGMLLIVGLLSALWETLVAISLLYTFSLFISGYCFYKKGMR